MRNQSKKTLRGSCNIKKGKFRSLGIEDVGKINAFELTSDDKNDDAIMVFAAADEDQYNEWKASIEVCFTIGETRRRKSVLSTSFSASVDLSPRQEPTLILDPPSSAVESGIDVRSPAQSTTEFPTLSAEARRIGIAEATSSPVLMELSPQRVLPEAPKSTEKERHPSDIPAGINLLVNIPDHDAEVQMIGNHSAVGSLEEKQRPKSGTPSGRMKLLNLGNREEGTASPSSRRSTPSNDLTEDQRQKLDKLTNRKSFKVPQSMKNLLNSNGLDKEREEILKQVKLELQSPADSPVTLPQQQQNIPKVEPKPPREIKLARRPTEPQRSGHLYKFDEKSKDHGEDAWVTQLAVLDVPSGQFELFSEVMG